MADLFNQLPIPANQATSAASGGRLSANGKRLGRPPGAKGKRSTDLPRYLEAMFGGMTPGQQSAEIAMAKPKDVAGARRMARELGIVDLDLSPLLLALVVKAEQLARALGCKRVEAWELLRREREQLLKYVHQAQPVAKDTAASAALPTVFLIPEGELQSAAIGLLPGDDADPDFVEDFGEPEPEVGRSKSDDDA